MIGEGIRPRRRLAAEELARLRDAAGRVFASEPRVLAAYLHGSAARGELAADLDAALACSGGEPGFAELDGLAARLQAEAGIPGLDVDLRSLVSAPPRFRANVLRDRELLFERDRGARLRLEARFMVEWTDFQPTWQRMRDRLLGRWSNG